MKIRSGFVSNSSSSSFIIGCGIVKNFKQFEDYCRDNGIEFSELERGSKWQVGEVGLINGALELNKDLRIIEGGNETELIMPNRYHKVFNNFIVRVQVQNDEGDGEFSDYDDNGNFIELNYAKAERKDFYNDRQLAIIEMFDQPFIKDGLVKFGAERNG